MKRGPKPGINLRRTCRKCETVLKKGDPIRKTKHGRRFMGECKKCASEIIVTRKWKKRGKKAIEKRLLQLKREAQILQEIIIKKGEV